MATPLPSSRWMICGLLLLATTLNYLDRSALNQLVVPMKSGLNFDDVGYSRLESNFSIAFALGTLLTGWLVDRANVRWVYPIVVFGWSLAGFCTGYADSFAMLMVCRIALGFFEAGNWPCGIRTTRTVLPPEERSFGNALFQSGTALGAILTPIIILYIFSIYGKDTPGVWKIPFRVIGVIGFVWVIAWLVLTPRDLFPPPVRADVPGEPFVKVFKDRRFWLLVAVIIGVNSGWHTVRVWQPLLLQKTHNFTIEELQRFSIGYFLAADIGTWTVGLLTLLLARKGLSLLRLRRWSFFICTLLLLAASTAVPWLSPPLLLIALLVVGFAALGLFPTYFALSQDLSGQHQGKITGTLGCINGLYLAVMFKLQGPYANATGDYAHLIAISGIPAAFACALLFLFWKPSPAVEPQAGK